ncbi:MAG TPA: YqgE/AlgH family protein [Gammaproteobacteria bacterium]
MNQPLQLRNHFLIAMPALDDPNFFHTVTYICEHNAEGAMGIVINRPSDVTLGDLLAQLEITAEPQLNTTVSVFEGGPVQPEQGFLLHSPLGQWSATLPVTEQIALTTSKDILEALAAGAGPQRYLLALGYAGWGPGQLEEEMAANTWLSGPASAEILFDTPAEKRWQAAAALLGVDLRLLSSDSGHA